MVACPVSLPLHILPTRIPTQSRAPSPSPICGRGQQTTTEGQGLFVSIKFYWNAAASIPGWLSVTELSSDSRDHVFTEPKTFTAWSFVKKFREPQV